MAGPLPKYKPTFSPRDVLQMRKVLRSGEATPLQRSRARLALAFSKDPGALSAMVARRLGLHPQTVRKWRKRWVVEGFSLTDKPRSGRPRKMARPQ